MKKSFLPMSSYMFPSAKKSHLKRGLVVACAALLSGVSHAGWLGSDASVWAPYTKDKTYWKSPTAQNTLWYSDSWHDWWSDTSKSGAPLMILWRGHTAYPAVRANTPSGWAPSVTFVRIPENPAIHDWVLRSGWPHRVEFQLSTPIAAPGASSVASCETAKAGVSDSSSFSTIAATGGSVADATGGMEQNTEGFNLAAQYGVPGIAAVTATFNYAHTSGVTWGRTVPSTWTDSRSFTHTFTQSGTLSPGIIGVPSVQSPMVLLLGLHRFERINHGMGFPADGGAGGDIGWGNSGNPASGSDKTAMYWGWISVPAKELIGSGPASRPVWYVDSRVMTVNQYKQYCKADFQARIYAPSMKAALCRAGIDKVRTCK